MTRVQQTERLAPSQPHAISPKDAIIRRVRDSVFAGDPEFHAYFDPLSELQRARAVDYLFATESDPHLPSRVFDRLRWGGQFVFASHEHRRVEALSRIYDRKGFLIERGPEFVREGRRIFGLDLPHAGRKVFYFVARKVHLVLSNAFSDRFTYDVHLEPCNAPGEPYVVAKRVPDLDSIIERLEHRFGGSEKNAILARAKKLHDVIFPMFLTREAAFLKLLQRDLPESYRDRVPRVISLEKPDRMVVQVRLNWMRKATRPIGQLDFAIQSADLLQKIHEYARIIHNDLRLDNFVITRHGVGFVDYGSSARVDENIAASPFLAHLFTEITRTSQIQRMLDHLTDTGMVTSELLTRSRRQIDKAIDLFYLAVQIDQPHSNPYTRELVGYDPQSAEAREISRLTEDVLRPLNPRKPGYGSARDVLEGLQRVRAALMAG